LPGAAKRNPVEPVMPSLRFRISIAKIAPARPQDALADLAEPAEQQIAGTATSAPAIIPSEAKLT